MKGVNKVKKIAAVALGAAMLGATFGAAVDLGDYPAPFVKDGQVNAKIVLGENAKVIDVLGAVNIAASFSAAGGEGTVLVEEKEGTVVNAVPFDELDGTGASVDDFPAKGESRLLNFDEDDSAWSHFVGHNNDDIDEDLNVKITATEGTDDKPAVDIDNFIYTMNITTDDLSDSMDDFEDDAEDGDDFKYKIDLFGKDYYVVSKWNSTATDKYQNEELQLANVDFYAHTGDEIDLAEYGYPGYKLVVEDIYEEGSNANTGYVQLALVKDGATVDSDEVEEDNSVTLKDGDTKVKVYANSVYYSAEKSQYTAKLSMESGTVKVGDYLDKDKMWKLDYLNVTSSDDKISLRVKLDPENDDWAVEGEKELEGSKVRIYKGVEQKLMDYAAVGFVGLTDQKFGNLRIKEPEKDKFVFTIDGLKDVYLDGKKTKASEITFKVNTTAHNLYVYSMTGDDKDDFENKIIDGNTHKLTFKVDDAKYELTYKYNATGSDTSYDFVIDADVDHDSTPDRTLYVVLDNDDDNDDYWDYGYVEDDTGDHYESGQSTDEGIKIVSYDEREREVEFAFPDDIVRYKVYAGKDVTGEQKETVTYKVGDTITEGGVIKSVGGTPLPVGLAILDTELPSPDAVKNGNYVVIGGPCVNSAAATLLGNPSDCAAGFEQGKAIIQLFDNNGKYALLVAGYSGADTLLATEVLGNYKDFADKFKGKDKVTISGTKISDVTIE